MTKTHASVLSEGVTDCGWNQDTQKLLCLDYISTYLEKESLVKFQSFLFDIADDELVGNDVDSFDPVLQVSLYAQNADILSELASGSGKYNTSPEEILDSVGDITDWNESTKFQLVCRFLDKHYFDKIEEFENMVQQIIVDESFT